jgi:hypothetical protein
MQWHNGKIKQVEISSNKGQLCRIQAGVPVTLTRNGKKIRYRKLQGGIIEFPTTAGSVTVLTATDQ